MAGHTCTIFIQMFTNKAKLTEPKIFEQTGQHEGCLGALIELKAHHGLKLLSFGDLWVCKISRHANLRVHTR